VFFCKNDEMEGEERREWKWENGCGLIE